MGRKRSVNALRRYPSLASLTERQREILQLVAEGNANKEIADRLGATVRTVEAHRAQLMERLGIRDVTGLVRFAIRAGLISSDNCSPLALPQVVFSLS